jgi:non-ribosomal peptide synthetase component F
MIPQPVHRHKNSLDIRPISHSQSRLWFLQKFLSDETVYNLLLVCHISGGTVNIPMFTKAWSIFVERHEVLHSKLVDTPNGLQQIPTDKSAFSLVEVEASQQDIQVQVEAVTKQARCHVFNLEAGELIRGWLLKLPTGWRFFLASHHLAWDRGSVPTIFHETSTIYQALIKGERPDSTLMPVPYQFIDYTLWQKDWMSRQELVEPHVNYWKTQLAGVPDSVSLFPAAIRPSRPTLKQYEVDSTSFHLESSLTGAIKDFCKTKAVTPFMFLASAVTALVYRLTGDNDIVIGIPDGDRGHTEFDHLVGFAVNMLAIRSKISQGMTYATFLEDYRKACLGAYEHRAVPFDYLLQHLDVPRRTSHSPIFQIAVNYQMQGAFPVCDYGAFKFTEYDHYNARSQSDFGLEVEETEDGQLHCVFEFDISLYSRAAMRNLESTFKVFVESIIATKGEAELDRVNLLSSEDRSFVSSILQPDYRGELSLDYLNSQLFPALFSMSVAAHPTKAAIIDDERILTYSELEIVTNRTANFLIESGIRKGDRVGVCCEQGIDMIIAIYGIVRAGCVYVPIDPDFPEERILSMIEDVELETVLVGHINDAVRQRILGCGISSSRVQQIDILATTFENVDPPDPSRDVDASDLFCCIFTSGSTGRPKGIYLGHKQLRYQMEGYHNYCGTESEDRLLLSSAIVFDMSLPSIFGTILRGATMIIASREGMYLNAFITRLISHLLCCSTVFPCQDGGSAH